MQIRELLDNDSLRVFRALKLESRSFLCYDEKLNLTLLNLRKFSRTIGSRSVACATFNLPGTFEGNLVKNFSMKFEREGKWVLTGFLIKTEIASSVCSACIKGDCYK